MSILSEAYSLAEKDVFRIEMVNGEKYIHFNNFSYASDNNEPNFFRNEEYMWLMAPIDEALEYGLEYWFIAHEDEVKQCVAEMTPEEVVKYFKQLNDGHYPTFISLKDINNDIPCGIYMTSMFED